MIRFPRSKAAGQRRLAALALFALSLAIGGCVRYVFLPVDVAYHKLSPPYVLNFVNETGAAFEVRPSSTGAGAGLANVHVPPGESFKAILQLRSFTVGAGSSVPGVQVVDGPYFEQVPPDKAEIRFVQGDPRSIFISLQAPSWFDQYEQPDAAPMELVVALRGFTLVPLFPRGPRGGP